MPGLLVSIEAFPVGFPKKEYQGIQRGSPRRPGILGVLNGGSRMLK
jgi:hypothetical protein